MTDPTKARRRDFLKATAALGAAASFGHLPSVHARGADTLKVGLIGCGGRGTGAAENICEAAATSGNPVTIHALADVFPDHLDNCRNRLKNAEVCKGRFDVTDDRCFTGFDAYKQVVDCCDVVMLATPPGFRPMMLEYAVKAGKHIFTEKPVGVDPVSIRRVLAAADEAKSKNLSIVAGTQRRHQAGYIESMKRIHDGAIGDITSARCYWNQGELWVKPRESSWSDMEWQVRNWLYFTWLSGDHIVEQHIHNIDVVNWAMNAHPIKATGMGGRQVRTGPEYGHIYDHFAVEFEYPNGVILQSYCRQTPNCANNVSEAVVGTQGAWQSGGYRFSGKNRERVRVEEVNPYVQEHIDLLASIKDGKGLNELRQVAETTLTAIMGRLSAYTGKEVTWDFLVNESKLDIIPAELAMGVSLPVPPVAMPGITELI